MPRVVAVSKTDGSVTFFDPTTRKRLERIAIGGSPHDIAVSPSGRHAYVTQSATGGLTTLDLIRMKVTGTIENCGVPDPAGITPLTDGRTVLVLSASEPIAALHDTHRDVTTATVELPGNPVRRAVASRSGDRLWVTVPDADALVAIPPRDPTQLQLHDLAERPLAVDVARDGRRLVMTLADPARVLVVDPQSALAPQLPGHGIGVGLNPLAVAAHPYRDEAFVVSRNGGSVFPVDLAAGVAHKPITSGLGACDIALAQAGKTLYVANHDADTIGVIDPGKSQLRDTWSVGTGPVSVMFA